MNSQSQNTQGQKLTIFKPPQYIYKLCRAQSKKNKKQDFEIYFNNDYSLRKYSEKIDIRNKSQLYLYEWRKQSSFPIIRTLYLELVSRNVSSSTSENGLIDINVYTQNIEKSLADMINLTLCEAIYVLKECLLAFRELLVKFSSVSISKFYIGLNSQGNLKVWINQNFAVNSFENFSSSVTESQTNEFFTTQSTVVNKVVHMISLLAHNSCKHFFFGLQKSLQVKKFTFNNCLQYINNFVSKTKNLQIPTNLNYMLPKRPSFSLERSIANCFPSNKTNKNPNQQEVSASLNAEYTNSFKHFGSLARFPEYKIIFSENQNIKNVSKQNNLRSKRYSQQLPIKLTTTLPVTANYKNPLLVESDAQTKRQCKVSLQVIMEKNTRFSANDNPQGGRKQKNSLRKQRPSINTVPTFLTNSISQKKIQRQNFEINEKSTDEKINSQNAECSGSLQNTKSVKNNLIESYRVNSSRSSKMDKQKKRNSFNVSGIFFKSRQSETKNSLISFNKNQDSKSKIRLRSASENIKLQQNKLSQEMQNSKKSQKSSIINFIRQKDRISLERSKADGDKTSIKTIQNDTNSRKRSFLTKTNYDSTAEGTDKNFSSSRMDFSSMSIENKITNKNFDSEVFNSKKEETKRSLMTFKYGFEQILENPSCKQVEEENETKSYNGSSLKNTDNIEQMIERINLRRNDDAESNHFSFGKNSHRLSKKKTLNDSIEIHWLELKQKTEQALNKNQWKKTINDFGELDEMELNQSIVDTAVQIVQRDPYPNIRLQKLQKLGKDVCFSIVKKSSDQPTHHQMTTPYPKQKSQFYQIF